ncbi:MAG: phosphotransferase [Gaiellales bacterium]
MHRRHPWQGLRGRGLGAVASRLPHGYTNGTTLDGETVRKRFLGDDAHERLRTEVDAIRRATGRVPVPDILDVDEPSGVVTYAYIRGRHGQELIDAGAAAEVLDNAGRILRQLHGSRSQAARLHGDFGPQNLLYEPRTLEVVGVLDWEFARDGDPVDDLAWAEWTVRMHHARAAPHLVSLFRGYGDEPEWARRHGAMISACRRLERRALQLGDRAAAELWADRAAVTAGWAQQPGEAS